jgi:hypothetical protein
VQDTDSWQIEYLLDERDQIISTGGDWDAFASQNDAPELRDEKLMGHHLLDFVSGRVTRSYIQVLIEQVRKTGRSLALEYRCDAPEVRRFMQMKVSPSLNNGIRFQSRVLRLETRETPVTFYRPVERIRGCYNRCSMCNRIKVAEVWGEAESLLPQQEFKKGVAVIYGICPGCNDSFQQHIGISVLQQ